MLLRHLCWLQEIPRNLISHHGPCGPPVYVLDGTGVCLSSRHAYLSGRTHCLVPEWADQRKVAGTQFQGRLMIPDTSHRKALKELLAANARGQDLVCTQAIRSLYEWLCDSTETGGWPLAPFAMIELVRVCYGTLP